jgi:hypothetical protein
METSHCIKKMHSWKGSLPNETGKFTLMFIKNGSHHVRACVRLPYVLMIGPGQWNEIHQTLTCTNFSLYTCINLSININWTKQQLYILKARSGVWLPVHMTRPWAEFSSTMLIHTLINF